MSRRRLALLLVLVAVVAMGVGCGERAGGEGDVAVEPVVSDGLASPNRHLERLRQELSDPNGTNDEILTRLMFLRLFYLLPPPPAGTPWRAPTSEGATDSGRPKPQHAPDLRNRESEWPDEYGAEIQVFRQSSERLWLRALTLEKIDRETNTNVRAEVNLYAAGLLSIARSPGFSRDIIDALEETLLKARYEVSPELYYSAFFALAWLGNQQSLVWMIKEFIHGNRSPARMPDQLTAAHRAMRRFVRERVDGRIRHRLVSDMIRTYTGTEALGQPPNPWLGQVFWERIGCDAIRTTQYFAGDPRDEDGQPLDTMKELAEWFRTHKDPSKPPWTDE